MVHDFDPTAVATPIFAILIVAEMIYGKVTSRARYHAFDTAMSLLLSTGNLAMGIVFGFVPVALVHWLLPVRMFHIGWTFAAVAMCFLLDDFFHYWFHRAAHRVRWMWVDHVNHHSSQYFNLSTALRLSVSQYITPGFLFRVPMLLLGFPMEMIIFVHGFNLIYQFWCHTETVGKLPRWFEAVMNTPSHHRVHHAANPPYLDSNYAGVFIVWDRLFGSFSSETSDEAPRYGLVQNLATRSYFKIALHEWLTFLRDLASAGSLRDVLGYTFAEPGWSPDGSRLTTREIKQAWARRHQSAGAQSLAAAPVDLQFN